MTGIVRNARKFIANAFGAGAQSFDMVTKGIDALSVSADAYYESTRAAAFTYKQTASEEAIHREVGRHINVMAELELDMKRDPEIFKAYEAKAKKAMKAWKAHQKSNKD